MLLKIRHETSFHYSKPVYCEPMTFRLRPRDDSSQRVESFRLKVTPEPAGINHFKDLYDNDAARCWFKGFISDLKVTTECVVETRLQNPFSFLLAPEAVTLPVRQGDKASPVWSYYAEPCSESGSMRELAVETLEESGGDTLSFLTHLAGRIYRECRLVVRPQGAAFDPEITWRERSGACRDLALVFNEVCRFVGLPARFVSGYGYNEFAAKERHLHAWSEVYLPGAGWRGFDTSIGLAVTDRHVAVATARDPHDSAPTCGTFRGSGVDSILKAEVEIEHLDERQPSHTINRIDARPSLAVAVE